MTVLLHDKCNGKTPIDLPEENINSFDDNSIFSFDDSLVPEHETSPSKSSKEDPLLPEKDAKDVRHVKLLIFIVILMSITGAVLVYFQTKFSEKLMFEQQFRENAGKVSNIYIAVPSSNI
jgi:hypothetical protein